MSDDLPDDLLHDLSDDLSDDLLDKMLVDQFQQWNVRGKMCDPSV